MRVLFCGDIVGRRAREALIAALPALRRDLALDMVVVNGENAAHGFGITDSICASLYAGGVDVITTGNHVWDRREIMAYIAGDPRLLRPINFPPGAPGNGFGIYPLADGRTLMVVNAMARLFMDAIDDPFAALERVLTAHPLGEVDAILVDFHGEASSEKTAMGHFCDGRASAVVGTHTHAPTADHHILPHGTAFVSDVGMSGDYDSIIGMDKDEPLTRFLRKIPGARFEPALGEATLCALAIETDDRTGLARRLAAVRLGGALEEARPAFW